MDCLKVRRCSVVLELNSGKHRKKKITNFPEGKPFSGFRSSEIKETLSNFRVKSFYYEYFLKTLHTKIDEDCEENKPIHIYNAPSSPILSCQLMDSPTRLSPCFSLTSSMCNQPESIAAIHKFALQFNGSFSTSFMQCTSHVVVNSYTPAKTFKILMGIACKIPVVRFEWITESLEQSKLLDPGNFLFNGGAKKCLTDVPPPFLGSLFFLEDSVVSSKSTIAFEACSPPLLMATSGPDLVMRLIIKAGGVVSPTLGAIQKADNKFKFYVYTKGLKENMLPINKLVSHSVIPVAFDWICESIYCYKRCDIEPHLSPIFPVEMVPKSLFF